MTNALSRHNRMADTTVPYFERIAWNQKLGLRWLYNLLGSRYGLWYVKLIGGEEQLWREAMRHAPLSYRLFGRTLSVIEIDKELGGSAPWHELKAKMRPGDKVWPFLINPWTLAMRAGYVVVRRRRPVSGVVVVLS